MEKRFLLISVVAKGATKPLFERSVTLENSTELAEFPFSKVIDSLDVLWNKIPHVINFNLSEL